MSPLVSILVPIYNVEPYIVRCVRSIFEQTYLNLEFVFVDDGSSAKSIEILQQEISNYPQWNGRIKMIRHDKNLGLAVARNTLVDNAKGDFLFYVDSDDWIEPNAVELMVKKQLETDADIVTGIYVKHALNDKNESVTQEVARFIDKDRDEALNYVLEYTSVVALWNRLIRSTLYHEHNIRCVEGVNAGEDLLITPRLFYYAKKVASCDAITYHYNRINSNSYVSLFPQRWDLQQQLLRACLLNVEFFSDKGVHLSEAMDKQLILRLNKVYHLTYRNHNRHGYKHIIHLLDDTNPKYWPLIGWDNPKKRWLDHHYFLKRCTLPMRRLHGSIHQLIHKT